MEQEKIDTIIVEGKEYKVTPEVRLSIELVQQILRDDERELAKHRGLLHLLVSHEFAKIASR
jgi:hypothetical protein